MKNEKIKHKKDGVYLKYHINGKLKEKVNFKDDKREGIIEVYHNNGRLLQRITYKNDHVVDYKRY